MAIDLQTKFKDWVIVFVVIPAALSMIICNVFLWRLLYQSHLRPLNEQVTVHVAAMEQVLRTESIRLRTLANLPATESLLTVSTRRQAGMQGSQIQRTEEAWAGAARDDMVTRTVLDNDLAVLFRHITEQNPAIARLLLTDASSGLIAATDRTPLFYQQGEEWWALARSQLESPVVSESITTSGRIGLTYPRRKENTSALTGMLRMELSLDAFVHTQEQEGGANTVLLVAQDSYLLSGSSNLFSRTAVPLAQFFTRNNEEREGWTDGVRYVARKLDAGVFWGKPMYIVAIREESSLSLPLYGRMSVGLLIGLGAVVGIYLFASNVGRKLFFDPMIDAADAGVWVLRKMYGAQTAGATWAASHPWARIPMKDTTPVTKELNGWYTQVQQELKGQAASINVAMQHDLQLATEFQHALLNRPYPQIPAVYVEGRLRLEFHHEYQPALALGGDFFDIEAISGDCAGVFIADVMGHGTRSALITSMIRSLLSELYPQGRNAAHFLKELNKNFCDMLKNLPSPVFASAAFFVADTTSRVATYSLAGHPPPFHLHRSVGRVTRMERTKPRGGALGLVPEEEFGGETVRLTDGDVFVFFTDGAYEASNKDGEEFGMARFEKALHSHIYEDPSSLLKKVLQDIRRFAGEEPVADDICLVAVHVTSAAPKKK